MTNFDEAPIETDNDMLAFSLEKIDELASSAVLSAEQQTEFDVTNAASEAGLTKSLQQLWEQACYRIVTLRSSLSKERKKYHELEKRFAQSMAKIVADEAMLKRLRLELTSERNKRLQLERESATSALTRQRLESLNDKLDHELLVRLELERRVAALDHQDQDIQNIATRLAEEKRAHQLLNDKYQQQAVKLKYFQRSDAKLRSQLDKHDSQTDQLVTAEARINELMAQLNERKELEAKLAAETFSRQTAERMLRAAELRLEAAQLAQTNEPPVTNSAAPKKIGWLRLRRA